MFFPVPFKDIRGQDTFKLFNGGFFLSPTIPPWGIPSILAS
jgi:hypothetical protein